jgi:hypothetical protein
VLIAMANHRAEQVGEESVVDRGAADPLLKMSVSEIWKVIPIVSAT